MRRSKDFYTERWDKANVPIKLRGLTFDDYQPVHPSGRIALMEARDFVEDFTNRYVSPTRAERGDIPENRHNIGKGLMFYGRNGTRKTTLAAAILTEVQYLSPSYRGYYIRLSDWQARLTDTYVKEPTPQSRLAERILTIVANCHVLVLDDIGQEYRSKTGFTADKLHELLRVRYESALPTIVTSNMDPDEMREVYGPSFDSFRHDAFESIQMLGKDSRKYEV